MFVYSHTTGGYYSRWLAMDVYQISNDQSFRDSFTAAGSEDLQPTSTTVLTSPTTTPTTTPTAIPTAIPTATPLTAGNTGSGQVAQALPSSVVLLVPLVFTILALWM